MNNTNLDQFKQFLNLEPPEPIEISEEIVLTSKQQFLKNCEELLFNLSVAFQSGGILENFDPMSWELKSLSELGFNFNPKPFNKLVIKKNCSDKVSVLKFYNSNLVGHFDKHKKEFEGLLNVTSYEEKTLEFINCFKIKLEKGYIIVPFQQTYGQQQLKQLRLTLIDLNTNQIAIIAKIENTNDWVFISFFKMASLKSRTLKELESTMNLYRKLIKSGFITDPYNLAKLIEIKDQLKLEIRSRNVTEKITEIRNNYSEQNPYSEIAELEYKLLYYSNGELRKNSVNKTRRNTINKRIAELKLELELELKQSET